ncbi:MAG: helix-turn-helix domain-containing protein [Salibacteraceae bacterium]
MSEEILKIESISHLHELMGKSKPTNPLISIIDTAGLSIPEEWVGLKFTTNMYSIAMKDASCAMDYGRNTYDFDEGVLIFTAPNQVMSTARSQEVGEVNGWMLYFHPDLIRNTSLGQAIDSYNFFSYEVHEALHLSDAEQKVLTDFVDMMKSEIAERIDNHSQKVIVSSLELLLNYSSRYYERQFNTRTAQNKDVVSQFESVLKDYYQRDQFAQVGQPSMEYFADQINLSPKYLSDLLKKETGSGIKDHLNLFLVEKAKTLLLSNNQNISEIAYKLGFNYPHYFSRLFKSKTGFTPNKYRESLN